MSNNKHNAIGNKSQSATTSSDKSHDAAHNVRQRHASDSASDVSKNQAPKKQQAKPSVQAAARPGIPFVTCPVCNTGDLCPRRRSSFKDWLALVVGRKPYRCNRCNAICYRK